MDGGVGQNHFSSQLKEAGACTARGASGRGRGNPGTRAGAQRTRAPGCSVGGATPCRLLRAVEAPGSAQPPLRQLTCPQLAAGGGAPACPRASFRGAAATPVAAGAVEAPKRSLAWQKSAGGLAALSCSAGDWARCGAAARLRCRGSDARCPVLLRAGRRRGGAAPRARCRGGARARRDRR